MTTADTSRRRLKLIAFAVLVLTFLAGSLIGVAYERVAHAAERHGRGGGRGPDMQERLGLTDEQDARVRAIFRAERPKMDRLFDEMRPRMQARIDSTAAAVEAVLTPEQRTEFRRMREERRRRNGGDDLPFSGRRGGPHRPHGPERDSAKP